MGKFDEINDWLAICQRILLILSFDVFPIKLKYNQLLIKLLIDPFINIFTINRIVLYGNLAASVPCIGS